MKQNKDSTIKTDLFILTAILVPYFLLFLGSRWLSVPDEGRYPGVALEMLRTHHFIIPKVNGVPFLDKPILYYWMEALAMKIFGINSFAIRLPPALFGIFGCFLTYFAGVKLFDRKSGFIAALVLATCPLYFFAAHYANMDLEVAVLITAAIYFFLIALKDLNAPSKKYYLWSAYIFAALAFLTKGLMGLAFPCMIVGMWIILTNRWNIIAKLQIPTGLLLFFAIISPWFIKAQLQIPHFIYYFFYVEQINRFLGTGFNNAMPFWFYIPIIIVGTVPWCFITAPSLRQLKTLWHERHDHTVEFILVLWIVLITIFFSIPQSKIVGYILPVIPPLALLMGNYLKNKSAKLTIIPCSIMMVFCLVTLLLIPKFDKNSSLPLVNAAKPYINTNTKVINYENFYYDASIYLNKKFYIVSNWHNKKTLLADGWQHDFVFLLGNKEKYSWMLMPKDFAKFWNKNKSIVIFAPEYIYNKLHTKYHMRKLAQYRGDVVAVK